VNASDPIALAGKILIAEDNAAMRQMLAALCRDWGAIVIECANGTEAVEAYAWHQPDWVLMDFAMPIMDGLVATARIKREFPAARILIVTDYDSEALRQAAREAGASGFVRKEDLAELPAKLLALKDPSVPSDPISLALPAKEKSL
jgi:CheY-like chemotaxis protein